MKPLTDEQFNKLLEKNFTVRERDSFSFRYQCATDQLDFAIKALPDSALKKGLDELIESFKKELHDRTNGQDLADLNDAYDDKVSLLRESLLKAFLEYNIEDYCLLLHIQFWANYANNTEERYNKEIYKRIRATRWNGNDSIRKIGAVLNKLVSECPNIVTDSAKIRIIKKEIYKIEI